MQLKFYARDDLLVAWPGMLPAVGQPRRYVGRRFDAAIRGYPATDDPTAFDSESAEGKRLVARVRRESCLWPADKETAAACGVEFVAVDVRDGVAVPKAGSKSESRGRKAEEQ